MRPRGALESFLLVAAPAGIAFGLLWTTLTDTPAPESSVIGLIFGAIMGIFGVRKFTEVVVNAPIGDQSSFIERLKTAAAANDLQLKSETADFFMFENTPAGSFSLGPVSLSGTVKRLRVRLAGGQATIVGPRETINELRREGLIPAF
jgi:hypothetical protein